MLKLISIVAVVLAFWVTAHSQVIDSSVIDSSEVGRWQADLRFLSDAMPKYHKNLFHTMSRDQFNTAVQALAQRIPKLTRYQIIVEMARIVALVGDGHTNIAPTRDAKIGFHTLPLKLYYFDDGIYVRAATKDHADLLGSKLIQVGNTPAATVYESVGQIVGRDNEMDVRFFAPLLMTMPEVLQALNLIPDPNEATFVLEKNGKKQTVKLSSVGLAQMLPADTDLSWIPQPGWVDARDSSRDSQPLWLKDPTNKFWFQYLRDARDVYVQVNQIGNKEDESMQAFSERLLNFINTNSVERLVLDLRLNRGGNGEYNRPLLRAIIKADKIDKKGRLFVLVGRSTWSAAQFLVNNLEDYSEALFVGEPTGGKRNSYGDSRRLTLPNSGITVRVSTLWWQEDERDARQWKSPDLAADMTFADYAHNIDPALRVALSYVPGKSLSESMLEALAGNNPDLAAERFKQWRASPLNRYANGEAQLNQLGYQLLWQKQVDQAIYIFKLNTSEYPNSSNTFDSLGEAYLARGDRVQAQQCYQRAVELDPTNVSAREALEKLRSNQH